MIKTILLSLGLTLAALNINALAEESGSDAGAESVVIYVDINNDGAVKMADLLEGVGQSKAQAIVDYREENGPFIAAEDLLNVKGIGPATLEKNRSKIRVGTTE
ncbi:helix-hairpin-helix domain-containing protein [Saccharospirillum sp. HFRX-1]|uniref:ComEA family DNA-binding protein n=1 Tax=unclassified Saccharospirillum TaxID=2633430 RepID=UPI00372497E4